MKSVQTKQLIEFKEHKVKKRGDGYTYDEAAVEYIRKKGNKGATVIEIANVVFNGDYSKAKNSCRRPREAGRIRKEGKNAPYLFCK